MGRTPEGEPQQLPIIEENQTPPRPAPDLNFEETFKGFNTLQEYVRPVSPFHETDDLEGFKQSIRAQGVGDFDPQLTPEQRQKIDDGLRSVMHGGWTYIMEIPDKRRTQQSIQPQIEDKS